MVEALRGFAAFHVPYSKFTGGFAADGLLRKEAKRAENLLR
jgi:hypothetical protein